MILRMKYLLLAMFLGIFAVNSHAGTHDFDIAFKVDGISNEDAVLAYYYMDKKYIRDTIRFDADGIGRLEGEMELNTGVYLLAFPSMKYQYFELLLGDEPKFIMETDTSDFIQQMKVTGSVENQLFYENMRFLIDMNKALVIIQFIASFVSYLIYLSAFTSKCIALQG